MIKAAAYCRVSTDKEDQLNSLTAQEEFFKGYCALQGYELTGIYSDEGLSGTKKTNRKAFLKMLGDAQDKKFDYLLVKDISRLARNIIDSIETIRFLKKHIKRVIFINQPNLTDDEFVLGIMGLIAQQESENLSKRVKFGKRINMEKGKVPNLVYGYDKVAGDFFHLLINEKEAEVIRRIFGYYTQDGYGCSTIANILNKENITTKLGSKWQQTTISRILKNQIYIGRVINGKQEMVEIYSNDRKSLSEDKWYIADRPELAIIDEDIYLDAQRILNNRADSFITQHIRSSSKNIFSTLIKCGVCKSSFRRLQVRNKNNIVSWGCNNRNYYGTKACSNIKTVKEEELLETIKNYLCDLYLKKPEMIKWTADEFKKLYVRNILSERSKKSAGKELADLKFRYDRQVTMCEKGLITFEEFEKRSGELKTKIELYDNDLKNSVTTAAKESELNSFLNILFYDMNKTLSEDIFTNSLLKKIVDYIEVYPDGRVKIYMKLLRDLSEDKDGSVLNRNSGT